MPSSAPRLSPRVRKVLVFLHRWAGILIGINLLLICLTGAILIYGEDIDAQLNPHLRLAKPEGRMITPEEALNVYRQARPGVAIDRIYAPPVAGMSYWLRTGPKSARKEAFVDPYRGTFLGERVRDDTLLRKIANFHIALLLPKIGRSINGFTAIGGLWIVLSGLFVWWPAKRTQLKWRMTIKRPAKAKRRAVDVHNVFGIYSLPILFIAMATGVLWAFEGPADELAYSMGAAPVFSPPKPVKPTGAPFLNENRILAIAERQAPGTHLVKFMLPSAKSKIAEVHREWGEGDSYGKKILVFIDAETGKVVSKDDSRDDSTVKAAYRYTRPLHRGLWAGKISRFLWAMAAIAPTVLFVTGLIKLVHRRRAKKLLEKKRERGETAPPSVEEEAEEVKEPALV